MPTRLSAALTACFSLLALGAAAAETDDEFAAMRQQADRVAEEATTAPLPTWLTPTHQPLREEHERAIHDITEQAKTIRQRAADETIAEADALRTTTARPATTRAEILVSWSMGAEALRALARDVAADGNAVLVFRGIGENERLPDAAKRIHALIKGIEPIPNVTIDPTRFRRVGATVVPTIAIYRDQTLVAKAAGISGLVYMRRRLASGATGDLGVLGPTQDITEADLITVMQNRLAQVDFGKAKQQAAVRYWDNMTYLTLPEATAPRTRRLDPTVVVTADIKDGNGRVVVPAGKVINPLTLSPFKQRLVVFDASRPQQVATAESLRQQYAKERVTFIATALDRPAGWDGLQALQNRLRRPVYVLTPEVQSRFAIQRVPSLISSDGNQFVIEEIPPATTTAKGEGHP